jgi:hypothetical protein
MAGKNQVTLTFAGDADRLSKTFSEVEKKSQDLDSSVKKSSKSIGQSKDAFDKAAAGADNTYDKFDSLESLGRGTTDTMSGLADIMKGNVLQGSTDLAGGVAALADGFSGALLPALKKAGAGIKAFSLSLLTNPIFLVVAALALLSAALVVAYKKSDDFRRVTDQLAAKLNDTLIPALKGAAGVSDESQGKLSKVVEAGYKFGPLGSVFNTVGGAVKLFGKFTEDAGDAMRDTGPAAEDWESAQKRLNAEVDQANKTIQTQLDLLDKWYGETKSQEEATISYAQSVDDAEASLKANGKTVDVHTAKGRGNRQSLLDLADSNKDLVDAMRANGTASDKLVVQNEAGRKKFIATATAMGMSKKEAEALATNLYKIPETRSTTVTANTAKANANVSTLLGNIKLLPNYKTIQIRYTSTGVNLTTPSGVGRATGGPVQAGRPYMVGERGPEMWVPSANGSIIPNHKMGAAGGDTTVYVTIDGEQLQGRIDKTVRDGNRDLKRTVGAGAR